MRLLFKTITAIALTLFLTPHTSARTDLSPYLPVTITTCDSLGWQTAVPESVADSTLSQSQDSAYVFVPRPVRAVPTAYFAPVVFDTYQFLDPIPVTQQSTHEVPEAFYWLEDLSNSQKLILQARQNYIINSPKSVRYNLADLPEPPKAYRAFIDPTTTKIVLEEVKVNKKQLESDLNADIELKKWLHKFDASLQFSQAYISPNWYQGGNNNLNMIGLVSYHVKLNPKFYPNLLFETNVQYKLSLNSAPDDSIHSVNISEDILQLNSTFGVKAAKRWFYSANLMFKTQIFNSYVSNSHQMQASFMSPGELNLGLGMTYNYENPKKTVAFGASISPLSWNLKTCINNDINETAYGIDPGRNMVNKVGSSAECTLMWKIAYNIVYNSRLFAFTDYDYFQTDWEHTIDFNINRFLSTRLYVHMRYDTETPYIADSEWHKFQLKEIFSFGFSYHFGV